MRLHPALVPVVHDDESPASACSRAGALAGRSARDLCLDMGIEFQRVVDGDADALGTLAFALRREDRRLPGLPVVGSGRRFTIAGEEFTRDALSRKVLRVCPRCVADDIENCAGPREARPYGRTLWTLASLRTCPEHRCPLVVASTDGRPQVMHDFSRLLEPSLNRVLASGDSAPSRELSRLERHLLDRLSGRTVSGWLRDFPAYAACRACEVLGAVALFGPRFRVSKMDDDRWHRAGAAGYGVANSGPEAIGGLLASLAEPFTSGRTAWGARALFGRLYEWLAHECDDDAYGPLRQVIRDFVVETMPVGPGEELFGFPVERRRIHSIHSFARETGRHPKTVRKQLLAAGLIEKDSEELSDERVLFGVEAARRLFVDLGKTLTFKEMRARLGAPRPHDRLIVEAGFIRPIDLGDSVTTLRPVYGVADVDTFLARMKAGAVPVGPEDGSVVDLPTAAKRSKCSAMVIVALLLERRLSTVRLQPGHVGYMSVLVDPAEVRLLVHEERRPGLTLRQVTGILRTSDAVTKKLVELGHLAATPTVNPMTGMTHNIVDPADLDAFRRRYVAGPEIARSIGTRPMTVIRDAERLGLRPAFDPGGVGLSFYDRANLPLHWRSDT